MKALPNDISALYKDGSVLNGQEKEIIAQVAKRTGFKAGKLLGKST